MGRRRIVVPALLVLAGLGWAAAHAVAHRLVMARREMPSGSLEGYLGYLPTSLALCLALAFPLAAGAALGKRWRGSSGRALWLFGLVPVLGFAGHAVAEPLLSGSGAPTAGAHLAPVLLVGLLFQIPFALAAVGLARGVLRAARSLAGGLAGPARAAYRPERSSFPRARAERVRSFLLEPARSARAPPSPHRA
jgi:hypothetical protein